MLKTQVPHYGQSIIWFNKKIQFKVTKKEALTYDESNNKTTCPLAHFLKFLSVPELLAKIVSTVWGM